MIGPNYICPVGGDPRYAVAWKNWYLGGPEPMEEPPEEVKQQMQLYDQLKSTVDAEEQARLLAEILQIAKDQFYVIGTARETEKYFITKNDLRNVPDSIIEGWEYCTPAPTRTEQFFFDR